MSRPERLVSTYFIKKVTPAPRAVCEIPAVNVGIPRQSYEGADRSPTHTLPLTALILHGGHDSMVYPVREQAVLLIRQAPSPSSSRTV